MVGRLTILICVMAAMLPCAARGDDLSIEASVDRSRLSVGDVVTLTVTLTSQESTPAPELPPPDGFDLVGQTSSTSTSISILNGSMTTTRRVSYIYSLRANREGRFVIGPVTATYNGQTYRSGRVTVEVGKSTGNRRRQTTPSPGAGSSARPQDLQGVEQNLFILAEPDKQTAYVGQQVTVTYSLYTRYDLQNVRYGQSPSFTGFWAETVFDAKRLNLSSVVVEGKAYRMATLKRVALFPTSAGRHELEQLEVVCDVPIRRRRRNLFDMDPFDFGPFSQTRQVIVRSGDLVLDVRPLPPGAPGDFGGAVGRFQVSAQASPTTVSEGDPITLRVTVSGTGNLNGVSDLAAPDTDVFRFYDPQSTVASDTQAGQVGGSKTLEYVVIPEKAGTWRIPPMSLSYFDPETGRYASAASGPIDIVVKASAALAPAPPTLNRQEVQVLGEDIRYIKPDRATLTDQSGRRYRDWRFLALQALPVLAFLAAYGYRRHRDRLMGDVAYARRRRSTAEARKRLAEARRLSATDDAAAYCAELSRAVTQFLADRLDEPAAGLTADSSASLLASRGTPDTIVSDLKALLEACDFARFAPGEVTRQRKLDLLERAEALINQLTGVT